MLAGLGKGGELTVILGLSPTNPEFTSSACLAKEQVSEAERVTAAQEGRTELRGPAGSKQNGLRGRDGAQAVRSNRRKESHRDSYYSETTERLVGQFKWEIQLAIWAFSYSPGKPVEN